MAQTDVKDKNVYIADISLEALEQGQKLFGYVPIHLPESCSQMKNLFSGAKILEEKVCGLTKSINAVKQDRAVD